MDTNANWQRLVTALHEWASASVIAPGQIEVTMPGDQQPRRVVIVMTPIEWEEMSTTMWGDFDDALNDVLVTLRNLKREERYAVYSDYRLEPSTQPTLPDTEEEGDPQPGGQWWATDPDGPVRSRFKDWTEPGSTPPRP